MQLPEKRPSDTPREVCRAVILIVRRSALVKVDSARAIDQCIDFFGESKERHAPCVGFSLMREKRPSDTPREACRAVILVVRPSALIKVDYPRAIDRCIDFFAEGGGGRAPRMIYGAMGGRAPRPDASRAEGGKSYGWTMERSSV